MTGWALGIDFGTSRSAGAMAGSADAADVTALEVEGNRWMPSLVLLDTEGRIVVGAAADNQAGVYPERLERTPKRQLGGPAPLLLAGEAVPVTRAVASVLGVFLAEGRLRRSGTDPAVSVLTHPVRWGARRKEALLEAGAEAGLAQIELLEEPVAAAIHYASDQVPVGGFVGVYDLGGGTFDTAVLQRTDLGFEVAGVPGGDEDIGGESFDHRLFRWFGEVLAEDDPELWELLCTSEERKWKRAALDLLTQARRAKEALSSYTSTQVFVPVADRDIVINRSQFEAMIVDDVEATIDEMEATISSAGRRPDELAAIYLVGGSSRLPIVAQLMTDRFGDRVTTRDEPKGVVALGAARCAATLLAAGRTAAPPAGTPPSPATDTGDAAIHEPPAAAPVAGGAAPPPPPAPPAEEAAPPPVVSAAPDVASAPTLQVDTSVPGPDEQPVRVAWRHQLVRLAGRLAAGEGVVHFGADDGLLHAVDLATGSRRWAVTLGVPTIAAPSLHGQVLLVATTDGTVGAFDAATGSPYWRTNVGAAVHGSPVGIGHVVVVGNDAGTVVGLDRASGLVRWQLPFRRPVRADPVVVGSSCVVIAVSDGRIVGVDPTTGHIRWLYELRGRIDAGPVLGDGVLYVPGADGLLYALAAATGRPLFGYEAGAPLATAPAVDEGAVYVVCGRGALHAVDRSTGRLRWVLQLGATYTSGPAAAHGAVYVDTGAGWLLALDAEQRTVRWRVGTGSYNRSRPLPVGRLVLVGTSFAQLYALMA